MLVISMPVLKCCAEKVKDNLREVFEISKDDDIESQFPIDTLYFELVTRRHGIATAWTLKEVFRKVGIGQRPA